jgi:hypothetical protein
VEYGVVSGPSDLDLVRKALTSGLSNCVEWIDDKAANRVRNNSANRGLTPEGIKKLTVAYVLAGGLIEQRAEEREEWKPRRDFWYRLVIPVEDFPHGLFVEMELLDDDPDVPVVALLNAHPQSR